MSLFGGYAFATGQADFLFVPSDVYSGVPISSEARYKCSFGNLWTNEDHPNVYPAAPSWSAPIFVVHSSKVKLWDIGEVATPGVASFAKTGDTMSLTLELLGLGPAGEELGDIEIGDPFAVSRSAQEQVLLDFVANQNSPFMSTIARMSPSPDWITGFSSLDLRQETGNPENPKMWYREFYVDTYPMTAGTMSGGSYSDEGVVLDPPEPIRRFTYDSEPAATTKVFLDATGNDILPVARWSCELLNPVEITLPTNPTTDFDGSVTVSAMESMEPTIISSLDSFTIDPSAEDSTSAPSSE